MKLTQRLRDKFWLLALKKSSRLYPVIFQEWMTNYGAPGDMDAEAYAITYNSASWAYICIRTIAETAASVPLKFYRKKGAELVELESGKAQELFTKVNPLMSSSDFTECTVSHLLINGNAYWSIEEENGGEIYPVRPDLMTIVPSSDNLIQGYIFKYLGKEIRFETDEIMHFKFFHGTDFYYGLSPLAVARKVLTMEFSAVNSNIKMFENQVRPGGVLEIEGGLSDPIRKELLKQWNKIHKGADKWHKMVILEGGLKWKETAMSAKDIEFIQGRKMNREEICSIFKVPPAIVGIFEYANYANAEAQLKMFWQHCIVPIHSKIASTLNDRYLPLIEPNTICKYDYSDVGALKEDQKKIMEVATGFVDRNILTINEVRQDYLNMPPVEWGDEKQERINPLLGQSIPIESSKNFQVDSRLKVFEIEAPKEEPLTFTPEEEIVWKKFDIRLSRDEQSFKNKVNQFLLDQKDRIVAKVDQMPESWLKGIEKKYQRKLERGQKVNLSDGDMDLLFNMIQENKILSDLSKPELERILADIGDETLIELGIGTDFNPTAPGIEQWLRAKILKYVRSVNRTTRNEIADIIVSAIQEEYTMQDISQQIADNLGQAADYRSERIARTELLGVHNKGIYEGFKQSGVVKMKKWLGTMDDRIRDSHAIAHNGPAITVDSYFQVGGALLMFPGDSSGDPGEVINCRCTMLSIL